MRKFRIGKSAKVSRQERRSLFYSEPADKEELWKWTNEFFGIKLTRESVCDHHDSQLDYLWHTTQQMGDAFVLACRNGGKTQLAAVGTIYDSIFHAPCETISIAGCLHPASPVLTSRGFKPIANIRIGDKVFDGELWRGVLGSALRPAIQHLKVSFVGFPPMFLTHNHPVMRIKGVECPLPGRHSPRVCSPDVNCAYHRHRFKCKGRGKVEEVPASELGVGDAISFPLGYFNCQNGHRPQHNPLLQGLFYGSHVKLKDGLVKIYKRYSVSREYDRAVLDQVRRFIGKTVSAKPVMQKSIGSAFVLGYDASFFKGFDFGEELPYEFFLWPKEDKESFLNGVMNGTRFNICNTSSANKAFSTSRGTAFALNLYSLVAASRPRLDYWDSDANYRLIFAETSIPQIKRSVSSRFAMLKPTKKRAGGQAILRLGKLGKTIAKRIKSIEEVGPSVPFVDIQVAGAERFTTLWGVVHNSKLQAGHMYKYTKRIFESEKWGIAKEDAEHVRREDTKLRNGSTIEILASSEEAAGGFHVDHIRIDQVDDMKQGVYDTLQFDIDAASEGHAQVDMVGTWDKLGGLYDKVLQKALEEKQKIFRWCLIDVLEPCSKDNLCSQCDLSDCCGGVAKNKKEGFLKREKAIKVRKRLVSQAMWETQALLKTPRPEDALIPKFNDSYPFVQTLRFNPALDTFRGFDWARCPSAVWCQYNEHEDRLYVIDEYMGKPGAGALITGPAILAKESREGYRNTAASYGDPSGASWITDFAGLGIPVISLVVAKDTRLAVLDRLLTIREDAKPGIIISTKCKNLRQQLLSYDIRNRMKQRGAKPDDVVDALLYLLGGLRFRLKLKDFNSPGTISIKETKESIRNIAKFSPQVKDYLEVGEHLIRKGKTNFNRLVP